PELIARVHAAIAWSPEVLAHVSKSSAAAGVAANQTVDVKARAASVPRRIGVIGMSLWTITSSVDHIATARSRHSYLRAAPYLLMRWSATLMPDQPSRLIRGTKDEERVMSQLGQSRSCGHVASNVRFARKRTRLERARTTIQTCIAPPSPKLRWPAASC